MYSSPKKKKKSKNVEAPQFFKEYFQNLRNTTRINEKP